ncbi:hypothetical protein [Stappia phage SI01]|uniref:Uncharacterized protein n=1 Tax=Stappia phage SI01 TaxID=2847766 RepID=A0AAE7SW27_9CAUD|nr:hypothetical protein [Stappia phage SI01]
MRNILFILFVGAVYLVSTIAAIIPVVAAIWVIFAYPAVVICVLAVPLALMLAVRILLRRY